MSISRKPPPYDYSAMDDISNPVVKPVTKKSSLKSNYCIKLLSWRNLVGILWLVPAIFLLVINFKGYIIGASLQAGSDSHALNDAEKSVQRSDQVDKSNHNILASLQFVAKILEAWFMFFVGILVYRLALYLLDAREHPISLLTAHTDFQYPRYPLDTIWERIAHATNKLFRRDQPQIATYSTIRGSDNYTMQTAPRNQKQSMLYTLFIVATIALCVVANLMGIATATLAIPTLKWIDINEQDYLLFSGSGAADAPTVEGLTTCNEIFLPIDGYNCTTCSPELLDAGNYTCTEARYGSAFDQVIVNAMATMEQYVYESSSNIVGFQSQEAGFNFYANASSRNYYAPNRQTLRDFAADYLNWADAYAPMEYMSAARTSASHKGYPESHMFNKSLQAQLSRKGPTFGTNWNCNSYTGARTANITADKQVRCYDGIPTSDTSADSAITKCIPWGSGWANHTFARSASFSIPDMVNSSSPNLTITIYSTPTARYMLTNDSCSTNMTSCNWDRKFSSIEDTLWPEKSNHQLTFEYTKGDDEYRAMFCDATIKLAFATYTILLPSAKYENNLIHFSIDEDSIDANNAIPLHPHWFLAAWSAIDNGTVSNTRASAQAMIKSWRDPSPLSFVTIHVMHLASMLHALSLIDYTTTPSSTTSNTNTTPNQKNLPSWSSIQVWSYSLDSRASLLGASIMIIGCIVVLTGSLLPLKPTKTPTEFIIEALRHPAPDVSSDTESQRTHTARFDKQSGTMVFDSSPGAFRMRSVSENV
ncbi:hypothetical protein BDV25DRAFT_151314 [Aspergillus avenaceus]|uniref:Uncharacterized protein n=1 Tax=Aspergillus avenaceus TaxID=36643 RepID=A0A5N6U118_ASPAV|nr:hypothetical protein BDV25DRAFT_151314 [Aspergillus avenaceus]